MNRIRRRAVAAACLISLATLALAAACCHTCYGAPEAQQQASQPTPQQAPLAPLTMEGAMRMAELCSPSVAAARRALELARLELQAAEAKGRSSVVLRVAPISAEAWSPVISSVGGEMQIPLRAWLGSGHLSLSAGVSLSLLEQGPQGTGNWGASLSMPILGSEKEISDPVRSAGSQVRKAESRLEESIRQARTSAQAAYFSVLAAQDKVAAADQALVRIQEHVGFVESRYAMGNAGDLDVLEARASIARARATAESARHGLTMACMNLNQAIGSELRAAVHIAPAGEYLAWPADMDLDACVQAALGGRPEIVMARQDASDAEEALARAIAAKRPDVSLHGQLSSSGKWNVGLEVSTLLTPNYSADIAIKSAEDLLEQARVNAGGTQDAVVIEVIEAFYNLRDAETAVELARSAAEIAAATLKVKEEQCRMGAVSYADVSEAIETVRRAESDLASSVAACFIAKSKLRAAIGHSG